jgi:hypothetical protein
MTSATSAPTISWRATALFSTLSVLAILLLGAASAQAKPSDPPVDFLMEINAASASFTPASGAPGEYKLVLRGVPSKVEANELTAAEDSALLPLNHFLAYWLSYGDVTGQFDDNPPRAVLRGVNPVDGVSDEVVVRLRDASRKGTTLTFDAEIIESTRVWNVLDEKLAEIDETLPPGDPDLDPTTLTDAKMFVDMPQRITQLKPESDVRMLAATRAQPQTTTRGRSCGGVYSSQLVTCWAEIGDYREEDESGIVCAYENKYDGYVGYTPHRGLFFGLVGEVDLGRYHWNPGKNIGPWVIRNPNNMDHDRCIRYFVEGNWYGIHRDASTYYTTDRCSYFMARWSTGGSCY